MIKFFRHIRKSLLMENKTGKYLKYAIGEIILVVIGILIALSINNWNEERKNRILEDDYYCMEKGLLHLANAHKRFLLHTFISSTYSSSRFKNSSTLAYTT